MAYTERNYYVPESKYSIKCPNTMTPIGICVHNTGNNAAAINEAKYMCSNNNTVSFHDVVDDKEVIHCIKHNRNAWHAGDGNGSGNRKYIGVEICYETGSLEKFKAAEKNAAIYIAKLLKANGWTIKNVKRHKDFSGKNCPGRTMKLGWQRFLDMVQAELKKTTNGVKYKVTADVLNVRSGPSTSYKVVCTVKKNEVYTIVEVKNNWGKLKSGAGWISLSYAKKV